MQNMDFNNMNQSDKYGFMSEKERKKLILKLCKDNNLNKKKTLHNYCVEYFITYGLHSYDTDKDFFEEIILTFS